MAIKDFHRATLNAGQRRVKHPAMAFFPGKFECNRLNLNYLFYLGQRNDFAGLILLNCDYVEGDLAGSALRLADYFACDLSLRECPQVRDRLWDNAL